MKFIYTRSNDEIRIDQIEDPEAVIYVPERFEDCPVTELGSYVLAHSSVEEIHRMSERSVRTDFMSVNN